MKILTVNFLTCAVKACKTSSLAFPLHFKDAELAEQEMEYSPTFLRGILPRVEWDALRTTAAELGFTTLPETKPEIPPEAPTTEETSGETAGEKGAIAGDDGAAMEVEASWPEQETLLRNLHKLLMETTVQEGKLVCGNCGHEYRIKEGIANFLLPNHLV